MLNLKQSDCRYGAVAFAAGEDLSLKSGYLAKLNAGGDLVLPQGAGEITPYVLTQGADQGYLCGAVPLTSAGNCRIKLAGACEAGDLLVAKGDGRVEAGALGGAALPIGTAEEKGVAGQHVLLRPLAVGARGADGATGAAGAAGADGADGGTLRILRSSVADGSALDASAVGRVLFYGEQDLSYQWRCGVPATPVLAAVIANVSGDADPVITLVLAILAGVEGHWHTIPADLVVGVPSFDGAIDVFDSGDGVYKLGVTGTLILSSTYFHVKQPVGGVYLGYTHITA